MLYQIVVGNNVVVEVTSDKTAAAAYQASYQEMLPDISKEVSIIPSPETLREMYESKGFQSFIESKLGNGLFARDPERAKRIADAAERGEDGSTHREVIEDWRDYLFSLRIVDDTNNTVGITREAYDNIAREIDDCERHHVQENDIDHCPGYALEVAT